MSTSPSQPPIRSPWIMSPARDLALFVATPLLIVPLAWAVRTASSDAAFILLVAAFGQVGHTLPGLIRAYGDRQLFARYRARFIVAPILLGAACVYGFTHNIDALVLASVTWAIWHSLMQSYGFVRIYASKSSTQSVWLPRLDFGMCLLWFTGALLLNDQPLSLMLRRWYQCSGFLIPAVWIDAVRGLWQILLLGVTGSWLWLIFRRKPDAAGWVRIGVMTTSIGFYWFAYRGAGNILIGAALFEIFHDVQYLAIVWLFNRRRAERDESAGAFLTFLFRRSGALVGLYVGLVFAFGSLKFVEHGLSSGLTRDLLIAFLATAGLLHYYYDGFIWKIRETSTSETLGLRTVGTGVLQIPALRHAAKWGLGLLPVLWLATTELRSAPDRPTQWQLLSSSLPDSAGVQFETARVLVSSGREQSAVPYLDRALQHNPRHVEARLLLAQLLADDDRADSALTECGRVLRIAPDNTTARLLASRLLAEAGNPAAAERQLRAALKHDPESVEVQTNLGIVLAMLGRLDDAITALEASLNLRDDADTHFNLAAVFVERGQFEKALTHYEHAVELAPDFEAARRRLRELQAAQP